MENHEKSIDKDNMKCAELVKLSAMSEVFVKDNGKELDTTETWNIDKMVEVELDVDQIEPSKSDQCKRENESEANQNEINSKINEIDKQWEGVNELLLQITTFFIFNATSLLIAVFAITWTKSGTVFYQTLVIHSQETIGNLEANFSTIKNDYPVCNKGYEVQNLGLQSPALYSSFFSLLSVWLSQ